MVPTGEGYILLLDDEPGIRAILTRHLQRSGYTVQAARSCDEALAMLGPNLKAAILDVILVNSGGRSGLDVLSSLRTMAGGEDVPVLMFTGYGLSPAVLKAIDQYKADLLHKPVPATTILDWLERNLGQPAG